VLAAVNAQPPPSAAAAAAAVAAAVAVAVAVAVVAVVVVVVVVAAAAVVSSADVAVLLYIVPAAVAAVPKETRPLSHQAALTHTDHVTTAHTADRATVLQKKMTREKKVHLQHRFFAICFAHLTFQLHLKQVCNLGIMFY